MRTHILATLAMAMIGSAGCVGGLTDAGPMTGSGSDTNPDATPRQQFDRTVAPLLVSERCAGCHVGPETGATNMFLGTANSNDSFYAGITNDRAINGNFNPAAAALLAKGQHEGPKWSVAEAATISDWLDAESAGRDTGSGTPTQPNPTNPALSVTGAEEQWAACLSVSQTEFTTTKAYAIADMQTENGRCYSCHEPGGAGGAYWGRNNQYLDMLSKWQTEVFITGAFQAQTVSTGGTVSYTMAVASNKICSKGKEQDNSAGTHPKFDCNQNVDGVVVLDAMASFTTMVQAKADSGACPTPAFRDPTAGSGSGSGAN